MRDDAESEKQLIPMAVDAAWKIGEWDRLSELLNGFSCTSMLHQGGSIYNRENSKNTNIKTSNLIDNSREIMVNHGSTVEQSINTRVLVGEALLAMHHQDFGSLRDKISAVRIQVSVIYNPF